MSYQALDINPIVQLDQQTSALSTWALTVHLGYPNGWFISWKML